VDQEVGGSSPPSCTNKLYSINKILLTPPTGMLIISVADPAG
jgi:hypothetical protein